MGENILQVTFEFLEMLTEEKKMQAERKKIQIKEEIGMNWIDKELQEQEMKRTQRDHLENRDIEECVFQMPGQKPNKKKYKRIKVKMNAKINAAKNNWASKQYKNSKKNKELSSFVQIKKIKIFNKQSKTR